MATKIGGSVEHAEREREVFAEAAERAAFGSPAEGKPRKGWQLPEHVERQFIRNGDNFHYTGGDKKIAWLIKDDKLVSKTNDPAVARLFVTIAQDSGDDAIKVSGTEEWRRAVWKEAAARNIEVSGYVPTQLEQAEMQRQRALQTQPNTVERAARTQTQEPRLTPFGRASQPTEQRTAASLLALAQIDRSNADTLAIPRDAMDGEMAREWVRDDLAALKQIGSASDRDIALRAMGHTAASQGAYREELTRQAPEVAKSTAGAFKAIDGIGQVEYERRFQHEEDRLDVARSAAAMARAAQGLAPMTYSGSFRREPTTRTPEERQWPRGTEAWAQPSPAREPQAPGRTFDSEGVSQKSPPPTPAREVYEGKLIDYGPENYKYEPGKPSYHVRLANGNEHGVLWGVGLEAALAESGATLGDRVSIERLGREAVNVNGAAAQRGVWTIQKLSPEKEAPAVTEPKAPTKQPDPPAVQATMRAAELFADERIERPEDRQRFLDMLRKTLDAAKARGETIPEPKIKETPEIVKQHDEPVRA
jgi:hypothetical protein